MTRLRLDFIDILILALILLGVVVSVLNHVPRGEFLLGAKYDLFPLAAFMILRRAPWSERFQKILVRVLLIVGTMVTVLGLISFFLPTRFFVALGYSDLHSLYDPSGPLAPYQQIAESWVRRIQGPMSGPNQLGVWLLLPLSVLLFFFTSVFHLFPPSPFPLLHWRRGSEGEEGSKGNAHVLLMIFLLLTISLLLTFSRAAWLAAFVMIVTILWQVVPRRLFKRVFLGILVTGVVVGIAVTALFPSVFFRLSSSRGHLTRPMEAIGMMVRHPLGLGLGAAGPATNRTSEPCVFLRPQDDPSWAKTQPQLCVFLGTTQAQPLDHSCNCPFLPENWYVQIGVELGVAGFVLFVALVMMVLRRLNEEYRMKNKECSTEITLRQANHSTFLFFLGVSIAALFLHAWEDAAVAYSGWLIVAIALQKYE